MPSIVYQTDRKTGIKYAYESTSYWDKEKKQPRSRRKYIGKVDPETGEIVPNGKRGRPSGSVSPMREEQPIQQREVSRQAKGINELNSRLGFIEQTLETLTREIHGLKTQAEEILGQE